LQGPHLSDPRRIYGAFGKCPKVNPKDWSETLGAFVEQQEKPGAVTHIEEDGLAAIAAKNEVINGAGIMKSRFAWHARKCR